MSAIVRSAEFLRIEGLPFQWFSTEELEEFARLANEALRVPGGTMELLPIQGWMLREIALNRGLLAAVKVGGGKTLPSLLASVVLGAKRPLLLVPAKLELKTRREIKKLSQHFKIPNFIRIMTYQKLGRLSSDGELERYKPDLIVADEVHKLKNKKASVTKNVRHYLEKTEAGKKCIFVGLSGTISRKSLKDYAHILLWSARFSGNYPLPLKWHELEQWSSVLDVDHRRDTPRAAPGAFLDWWPQYDPDEYSRARKGYQTRFSGTPGIVVSLASDDVNASLLVSDCEIDEDQPEIDEAIAQVRAHRRTEEGYSLATPMQVWQQVRQRALGMHYRYKDRPPVEWFEARYWWAKEVQSAIEHTDLRSEADVARAHPDSEALQEWRKWKAIVGRVETEAVWHSEIVIDYAADWLSKRKQGICWVDYLEFGNRLASKTGLRFFSEGGLDSTGMLCEDAEGPIICSNACREGFNLQFRHFENLDVSPHPSSEWMEQKIGRTHRQGQPSDEVSFQLLVNCAEHAIAIEQCLEEARGIQEREGLQNKLLICDLDLSVCDDVPDRAGYGARWR